MTLNVFCPHSVYLIGLRRASRGGMVATSASLTLLCRRCVVDHRARVLQGGGEGWQ